MSGAVPPRVDILSCEPLEDSGCVYYITTDLPIAHDFTNANGGPIGNANGLRLARELYTLGITDFAIVGHNRARLEAPILTKYAAPLEFLQAKLTWEPLIVTGVDCMHTKKNVFEVTTNKSLRGDYFLLACCNGMHKGSGMHVSSSIGWFPFRANMVTIKFAPKFDANDAAIKAYVLERLTY